MVIFTIYERQRDYPEGFVVRRWHTDGGRALPDATATYHPTLAKARARIPDGMIRIERSPGDDPVIREVWL